MRRICTEHRRLIAEPLEQRCLLSVNPLPSGREWQYPDGLFVPSDIIARESSALDSPPPSGSRPYGAVSSDTTEFMLGDVQVTLVLLESNGTIDAQTENWTPAEISQVRTEVQEGLQWWKDMLTARTSKHTLNFNIDFTYADTPVQTGYEPITRSNADQGLWIDSFLTQVGYNSASNYFTDMGTWDDAQRLSHNAHWAYTIFVVDSSADADGTFSNGRFAYAYFGGPFTVMTYDNDGWGIDWMGQVLAHETGHIFYAMDEYPDSGNYTDRSGYYNTQNLNAFDGNPDPASRVNSIMAEGGLQDPAYAGHVSSPTSLQALGWRDTDSDGIFDLLDVPLTLTGASGSYNVPLSQYQFTASSSVATLTNLNPNGLNNDITTNTVDRVQYSLDGGPWTNGNTYGTYTASISQNVPVAVPGSHSIQFRTIFTESGLTSNVWSDSFMVAGDSTPPTAGSLVAANVSAGGPTSYTFTVNYTDDTAVDVATLDGSDVRVTGPGSFNQLAAFVSVNPSGNGTPRVATYRITPPGGSWDIADNGTYTVAVEANQVRDTSNNAAVAGSLGTFSVNIADTTLPTAGSLVAPNVIYSGGTSYSLTVTYSDDVAVDVATLDGSDVRVTGPGFNQLAAFVGVSPSGNGTPRVATYQFTPPGGSWNPPDNGTYTVALEANQVRDTSTNAAVAGSLGTFSVNIAGAAISGVKFNDLDGDGVQDVGEPGLPDWTIYLDSTPNGVLDTTAGGGTFSNTNAVTIPDNGTANSNLVVSGASGTITDVNVTLSISNRTGASIDSELSVFLIGPSGTRVKLFSNVGGTGLNFTNTTLDDEAATSITAGTAPFNSILGYRPEGWLSTLDGASPNGTWRMEVTDTVASGFGGFLASWSISVTTSAPSEPNVQTLADGSYTFTGLAAGSYTVREVQQLGWTTTAPATGSYSVTLATGESVTGRDFGNRETGKISGQKWDDVDNDGLKDAGEPGLDGWTIELVNVGSGAVVDTRVTAGGGLYEFSNVPAGTYTVREVQQTGWNQTFPIATTFGTPELNFTGQVNDPAVANRVWPPNTVGDVGFLHYVQATNDNTGSNVTIYNKADGSVAAGPFNLNTLAVGAKGGAQYTATVRGGASEPVVLYDHLAQRWLLMEEEVNNRLNIFISDTSTPTDSGANWTQYRFVATNIPVHPKIALWPDAYFIGTEEGGGDPVYALNRPAMLAGSGGLIQPASFIRATTAPRANWQHNQIMPADLDGPTLPPTGAAGIFVRQVDDEFTTPLTAVSGRDLLEIYEFRPNFGTTTSPTYALAGTIAITEFDYVVGDQQGRDDLPQPPQLGTTVSLDAAPDYMGWRVQYRNFGTYETLVGNFTVDASGTEQAGIRWFELRRTGAGAWTKYQEGTFAPDSTNRWMGSISMDGAGNIALAYNVTNYSTTVYPGIRYVGRQPSDPLGTLPRGEYNLIAGAGAQIASNATTAPRWGESSAMSVDPNDDSTFWFTGEYLPADGNWATRIGTFAFRPTGLPGSHTVVLARGQAVLGLDFGNFQPATISGQKWNDLDGNGLKDAGEPGLPGWTIFLDSNNNGVLDATTGGGTYSTAPATTISDFTTITSNLSVVGLSGAISDVNVTLNITHASDSDLDVYLISPGGTRVKLFTGVGDSSDNFTNTTLDDEAATAITAGAAPFSGSYRPEELLSALDGAVPDGTWQLEITDAVGGNTGTLSNWSIIFTTTTTLEPNVTTAADGSYSFTNLVTGTYIVREVQQLGWNTTAPTAGFYSVAVAEGQTIAGRDFGNRQPPGEIHGQKWNDVNGNGLKDAGEPGLDGWFIELVNASGAVIDTRVTAGGGFYDFTNLPPATYEVREVLQGGWNQTFPVANTFGTPNLNINGQAYTGAPSPDTAGDVGPNHYVQVINASNSSAVQVYNKSGGLLSSFTLSSLGGPVGGGSPNWSNPIVLYDGLADRWLLTELAASGNTLIVHLSKTPIPTSNPADWYLYTFDTPTPSKYPKFSVWPDAYYVTSNEPGVPVYALDRTNMLAGLTPRAMQRFTAPDGALDGFSFQALAPADLDGPAPPAGAPAYFMRHRDSEVHTTNPPPPAGTDLLQIYQFHVDFNTPANSTFTGPTDIQVADFDSSLNGLSALKAFPQPGTSVKLNPLREVIMQRLQYRNFPTHETLVGNFVTDVDGADHGGVRWFELRRSGAGPWSLYQEGTVAPDAASRWLGGIAMDGAGSIALAYNVTSSSVYPGIRYVGRLAGDPLGTMPRGEYTLIAGAASQTASTLWGGYSAMSVDPADNRTFWFTGEYISAGGDWATRIGAFAFNPTGLIGSHTVVLHPSDLLQDIDFGNHDPSNPTVTKHLPLADATITTTDIYVYLTFSEVVLGVDESDLVLGGTAAGSATAGSPFPTASPTVGTATGPTWAFHVTGLTNGMLTVTVAPDANDIEDAAGNDLVPVSWTNKVMLGPGRIAFDSYRDGNGEIYVMNADGSNQTRLTDNAVLDYDAAFSADGSKIAFASYRDGNSEIYVMDADGGNQTRLTDNGALDAAPSFSPDGAKIAFTSNRDGNTEIYVMNADGTGQTRLTSNAAPNTAPSFSPDGSKIVFTAERNGNSEIYVYVMDDRGNYQTRLTRNTASDYAPAFSSDGSQITFTSDRDGNAELYRMNADGSAQTRVTDNPASDAIPTYRPTGGLIAFVSSRNGNDDIYSIDLVTKNTTRLTSNAAQDRHPSWGPGAPTDIGLSVYSVAENQPVGTLVGMFATTDLDPMAAPFTYSLVSGTGSADNASFTFFGDELRTAEMFDYEAQPSHNSRNIRVRSTGQGGQWIETALVITVTDVLDPTDISLLGDSVLENQPAGTSVGTFITTDQDPLGSPFVYSLISGTGSTDNDKFAIFDDELRTTVTFDYEKQSSYSIRVRSTDQSGQWVEKALAITVTDVHDISTVGIYDPIESRFYLKNANDWSAPDTTFVLGIPSPDPGFAPSPGPGPWMPIAGDWDGDGADTVGLYDPKTSWVHLRNSNSAGPHDVCFGYGVPGGGWIILIGDWDGNGTDTVGLYNPASSHFYLRNSLSTGVAEIAFGYGVPHSGWTPLVGDWNGDGVDTIGLFDPTSGIFYLRNTNTTGMADVAFPFGVPNGGWTPLIGDWNGDGIETAGFYQPGPASHFHLRNSLTIGVSDIHFGLGFDGVKPIVGNWLGALGPLGTPGRSALADPPPALSGDLVPFTARGDLKAIDPTVLDRIDLAGVAEHELGQFDTLDTLTSAKLSAGPGRLSDKNQIDSLFARHE